MAERSSSDLSPGVPTAQGSVALSAILHRLVTIEERVEDLERYQKQLYDDSRQMLEDHLDDRWNMAPSFVHPSSQDNEMYEAQAAQLRALKKPLDDVRGRVEDLQQEQRRQEPALEEMRTSNAELRERLTQLHKNNLAREQKLRDNAEKLDEMRARWEEAQWRISPGQLNPTVLFNQVGPLLLSALKEDVQISHEGIIRGIHDSLTEYQTRMLDAVWETLKPTIQLSTAIQQIMEEHSALKAKGDMTNPQVQAIATVATPDDSQTGSCLIH
ncbi:hypothetical protein BDW22DRAFT_284072 [Trametopsis cervina]|nr:hypothetical protein BDW22DRAFT_284072 [Trametopsis cervina]